MSADEGIPTRADLELIASAIAEDDYATEANGYASWLNNHSCGGYGCCGGGYDVDREALTLAITDALLAALSRSGSPPQQTRDEERKE